MGLESRKIESGEMRPGAGVWLTFKAFIGQGLRVMGLLCVFFGSWPICLALADPTMLHDAYVMPVCALVVGLGVVTGFMGSRILRKTRDRRLHSFGD